MSTTLRVVEEPGDAELISAVRGGDSDAYGVLFERHVDAARRLARQLVSAGDVDDLVSEAFAKVLVVLQRGGGPDLAFRAYLLTAVRRLHVDRIRATARVRPTDDLTPFDPGVPFRDTAVEGFESSAAARAFASLPERWQLVLWHTEVEGQKPAEVAPLLGMSANSVAALAYRAREGLRQAFLGMHVQDVDDDLCAWTHRHLGPYVRNGISRRDATRVEQHLDECRRCTAIYLELTEVNSNLAGLLGPALLGGVAAAYVGSATGVAAKGGVLVLLDRARDFVASHGPASAAAGVAATAVIGGVVFVTMEANGPTPATAPPARVTTNVPTQDEAPDGDRPFRKSRPTGQHRGAGPSAAEAPADAPASPGPPPTADDAPSPAPDDTSSPNGPPPPPPPPPPDPEAQADLRVTASATPHGTATYRVTVVVAGVTADDPATLHITSQGVTAVISHDSRCDLLAVGSGTCRVESGQATFEFMAVAPPTGPSTLVFTVTSEAEDADPGNNRVEVPLAS